jgi:hypothetical protein
MKYSDENSPPPYFFLWSLERFTQQGRMEEVARDFLRLAPRGVATDLAKKAFRAGKELQSFQEF